MITLPAQERQSGIPSLLDRVWSEQAEWDERCRDASVFCETAFLLRGSGSGFRQPVAARLYRLGTALLWLLSSFALLLFSRVGRSAEPLANPPGMVRGGAAASRRPVTHFGREPAVDVRAGFCPGAPEGEP